MSLTRRRISGKLIKVDIKKFIASLALCFAVAYIGSNATLPSIGTWYTELNKPELNPPNWIFGLVWTILYFFMALAFSLVWSKKGKGKGIKIRALALQVFLLQLGLNLLWSFLFFNFHLLFFAFIEIIILWFSILFTIILFKKFSYTAAFLLVPYIVWVSFATYLTFNIWRLNP